LVSHPLSSENSSDYEKLSSGMLFLYINGIACGGVQRGTTDNIHQDNAKGITLQGTSATLEVHEIRAYNSYLTADQVLSLYILNIGNIDSLIAKYESNDIIDSEGNVTVDSLPEDARYVVI